MSEFPTGSQTAPPLASWGPPADLAPAPAGQIRCWQCRAAFAPLASDGSSNPSSRYCTKTCRRIYAEAWSARHGRCLRCRWYGGHGPNCRLGIAERDGWTCQLCHLPVDPSLVADHPLSPSFDHGLARTHGGPNHEDNLRLTHRICNNLRGSPRPGGPEPDRAAYAALVNLVLAAGADPVIEHRAS